jgi:hypothetical protein
MGVAWASKLSFLSSLKNWSSTAQSVAVAASRSGLVSEEGTLAILAKRVYDAIEKYGMDVGDEDQDMLEDGMEEEEEEF